MADDPNNPNPNPTNPTPTDPPANNTPEARNPDGSLKSNPPPAEPDKKDEPEKKDPPKAEGAPEKYEPFKAPEGYKIDEKLVEAVAPVFKELGLTQDQAQKLVDVHNQFALETEKSLIDAAVSQQDAWKDQTFKDATLGNGKDDVKPEVKQNISAIWTAVQASDPKGAEVVAAFKEAMNLTGAGNHPAFVGLLNAVGKLVGEGKPVIGNPPPNDNKQPGSGPGPQALYPTLKSGT